MWLAPWIGRTFIRYQHIHDYSDFRAGIYTHTTTTTLEWFDDSTSIGVNGGYDVVVRGCNRASLFASARAGVGDYAVTTAFPYTTFVVGFAYRHVGH